MIGKISKFQLEKIKPYEKQREEIKRLTLAEQVTVCMT